MREYTVNACVLLVTEKDLNGSFVFITALRMHN